jgi:hypothetical protein
MLQAPVNERYIVVKFLLMQNSEKKNVCFCESELVIPSLKDRDCIYFKKCIAYTICSCNRK